MEKVPYLGTTVTRWTVGPSTFLALPEKGARLMHWNIEQGDGTLREVVHWPEGATLEGFAKVRGGNPILFPFNARVFEEGRIHAWRDPDGVVRDMPMHGFARQGTFRTVRMDERGFEALFVPDEAAKAGYPFDYEFSVTYRFGPQSLVCELMLRNLGGRALPWSAGHHFYFSVPWTDGHTRADYAIRIPAGRTLRQDAEGRLIPGPVLKPQEPLSNPALLETFHLALTSPAAVFGPVGTPGQVAVKIGTGKTPPPEATFVTWTESDKAPFYCVEPWMGPANAPGHKLGLHWVPPGQSQSFVVEVAVT